MSFRSTFLVVVAVCVLLLTGAADEKTLISVDKAPNGLAPGIASLVNPKGFRVQSAEGPVCDVWLLKNVALKPGFKQTLNVKYPFQTGELVGVLRVGDKVEFSDFRGQPVKASADAATPPCACTPATGSGSTAATAPSRYSTRNDMTVRAPLNRVRLGHLVGCGCLERDAHQDRLGGQRDAERVVHPVPDLPGQRH